MRELESFRPYPQARFASSDTKRCVFAQHPPRQNQLLAATPLNDYARLLPALEPVPLPLGFLMHRTGDREKHVYFITAGLVARFHVAWSGASAEFALVGNEGVIGIASFLGGESTPGQALVLGAGHAYRLAPQALKDEFKRGGALEDLLLRYTHALISQTMRTGACNRHHAAEQQLCRWILSSVDRLHSNELTMTQEVIAQMMGVRRESVTQAAGKLQDAGLIRTHRGHIEVLDRTQLEARACECYAADKREYDRLLPGYRRAEAA